VLENPFSRLPTDTPNVNLLNDPRSIAVCDLFNGIYEVMLQLLMRFFSGVGETDKEKGVLIDSAISLMSGGLAPVAHQLTRLPAGSLHPEHTAGPSFEIFPSTQFLPHKRPAWIVMQERLLGLAASCESLSLALQISSLEATGTLLRTTASRLVTGQ
jgi:hypothetical protein